jgi:hypothetical protein
VAQITTKAEGGTPPTPPSGYVTLYNDGLNWKFIRDSGAVFTFSTGVTPEEVQDIVGAFFADSSTINVTYNDAGDVISADVIASAVDHDALANFVANEHINHSTVSVNAGTGLVGGGDLTATRTISMPSTGTAGTYKSVTTDAQGRVTNGTNPTTLAGFGIVDAQPLDGDLTAVAGLATTGIVTRTAANTMATRTVTAGSGINVTNGDGVSGNPTVSFTGAAASAITNTPAGNISAGTVQGAINELDSEKQSLSEKGVANGYASLDSGGKVPAAQLPSFVDDVLEFANLAAFPVTGATGVIYVALATNKTYRWSGSVYVEISPSDVTSVFGRSGAVAAVAGDYNATQISNAPAGNIASTTVQAAINELDTEKIGATRAVNTGAGLSGGGALSSDLTLVNTDRGSVAVATHEAAGDPHPQYTTAAELSSALGSYQPLDGDLTAVANLTGAGLVTRTSANNMTTRSIAQGTGITVANGDGVAGNPTITNSDTGSAAVATHVAAGDPHTQYQLESALPADVRATTLTGISITNGVVAAADSVLSAFGKIQGWINDASTNFAASVRGTVLTGLSVVNSAVTAADSILTAIGKIQGQLDELFTIDAQWIELNTSSTYTNTSSVTGVGVTELDLAIVAGTSYYYEATLLYQSAATNTGLEVTIVSPDGASAPGAVLVNMQQAGDGTAALFTGTINALGDYVESTGVQTSNTPYVCHIKGNFPATASGTLRIAFRSENGGTQVTVLPGSTLLARAFS